jgi:hypothetical protein
MHVVDDVLGLAHELLAELRVLRGDAHRAGVAVALPQHDAAQTHERPGAEAVLLSAQQRRDGHVAARLQAPVHPHPDAGAEVILQKHLLCFRHTELPGQACRLDGGLG